MVNPLLHYRIRRLHRILGVIIGVQFLMWTLGGLYFSWSDMDEVHGDYELAHNVFMPADVAYVSPSLLLDGIKKDIPIDSIIDLKLISIDNIPHWQATCQVKQQGHHQHKILLWDAVTGNIRTALKEQEAIEVARKRYLGTGKIKSVAYITETSKHHEYREQPVPAYAITFDDSRHTTFYVASELGVITRVRNQPWRRFDFLWMMHTMDYESRDNITNWLLRIFSIFGLATVASGFTLFFVSIKRKPRPKTTP